MKYFLREIKYVLSEFYKKKTRGFSNEDIINLDETIAKFVYPRFLELRKDKKSVSGEFYNKEFKNNVRSVSKEFKVALKTQKKIYDSIEYFLRIKSSGEDSGKIKGSKWVEDKKYIEGRDNFGKYFDTLWR